jgi:hypothetical protein
MFLSQKFSSGIKAIAIRNKEENNWKIGLVNANELTAHPTNANGVPSTAIKKPNEQPDE